MDSNLFPCKPLPASAGPDGFVPFHLSFVGCFVRLRTQSQPTFPSYLSRAGSLPALTTPATQNTRAFHTSAYARLAEGIFLLRLGPITIKATVLKCNASLQSVQFADVCSFFHASLGLCLANSLRGRCLYSSCMVGPCRPSACALVGGI